MPGRKLIVEITGDTKSLERALGRAGKETQNFGSKLSSVGKTAGLAAGAAGIGALTVGLKIGISEWTQSNKVAAQTNAVLKSTQGIANVTAKHVDDLATSIMNYSGIDDEAIKSTENLLLGMTNIRNEAGKGNDIFDRATKVITDFSVRTGKSASTGVAVFGKALNDLGQGKVPTTIRGIGKLSDGLQTQMKAMLKSGDVTGAQGLLLKELEKRYGGAAEAAGKTLPGQLSIAREKFNNFAGDLVAKAVPALQRAIGWLKDHWPEIKSKISEFWSSVKPILDNLMKLLAAAWPIAQKAIETFLPILKQAAKVLNDVIQVITALLSGDWSKAWSMAKQAVIDEFNLLIGYIKTIAGLFWDAFSGTFDSVFVQPFKTAWNTLADWFNTATGFVSKVADYIGGLPKKAWDAYVNVFETVYVQPFKAAFNKVADWFNSAEGFVTKVVGYIGSIPSKIADFGGELLTKFTNIFTNSGIFGFVTGRVQAWADEIKGLPGKIVDFSKELVSTLTGIIENNTVTKYLESVPGKFADFFKDLPSAIGKAALKGVKGGMSLIGQMIDKLFGKLAGWVKGILGIASPSKEFEQIGHFIIQGLVKGLEDGGFKVKDAIMEIVKKYVLDTGWDAFKGFTSDMWDELSNMAGDVGSFFTDLFGNAAGGVSNGYAVLPELPQTDHPTLGLEGYPAKDIMLPAGTVVGSPSRGTITRQSGRPFSEGWSDGPGSAIGLSLYMAGRVADYFLTHFDALFAGVGASVGRGTPLGTVGPMDKYGVASHIHEGVKRLAAGGIVTKPTYALVGEAGPEAVIPLGKYRRGGGRPEIIQLILDGKVLAEVNRKHAATFNRNNAIGGTT